MVKAALITSSKQQLADTNRTHNDNVRFDY